jgi:hypothetical protein
MTGLCYGVATQGNTLFGILVSLMAGFIYSAPLVLIGLLFFKASLRSNLIKLIAALLMGVVGLIVSLLIWRGLEHIPRGGWERIDPPPERLVEIGGRTPLRSLGGELFGRTEAGTRYLYVCEDECRWEEVDAFPTYDTDEALLEYCSDVDFPMPPAPGRVAQSYQIVICGGEGGAQHFYLLLEDSSLWTWSRSENSFEIALWFIMFAAAGLGIGFIGSVVWARAL